MRSNPRRRAREFVLQGLYQRQLSGNAPAAIRAQLAEAGGFALADGAYFETLWSGVTAEYDAMVARVPPWLDRPAAELSPVERSILVIGAWELAHRPEIPYRVVDQRGRRAREVLRRHRRAQIRQRRSRQARGRDPRRRDPRARGGTRRRRGRLIVDVGPCDAPARCRGRSGRVRGNGCSRARGIARRLLHAR